MQKYPRPEPRCIPMTLAAVFEVFIKTTPERLWEAITDADLRARYSFGVRTESDYTDGSAYKSSVAGRDRHRRGREPRGRPAPSPRPDLHRAVERRGEGRGRLEGDLGDRDSGRRLLPADGRPRSAEAGT